MSADPDSGAGPVQAQAGDGGTPHVDARQAVGVQVGQDNTQIIYNYGKRTWADGAALPPLVASPGRSILLTVACARSRSGTRRSSSAVRRPPQTY